jgi:pyruvate formate lyase activating enzyme
MIFNIQRFSTHDGAGIRTIVFYKGCPLRCSWCCNPESQSFGYSLLYDARVCKSFGDCLKADPEAITADGDSIRINRTSIPHPEKFKSVCLSKALTVSGEEKPVDELVQEIEKDLAFFQQSGGGVTLSGGEPLSQGEDMIDLLRRLKEKSIHVSMETSLHVRWEQVERCIGLVDMFLVDLKHTDHEKFASFTQGDASLVMDNLQKLSRSGTGYIIRVPVIPGFNHSREEISAIIDFTVSLNQAGEIHFLPYHSLGKEKYTLLGMDYTFGNHAPVDEKELQGYVTESIAKGLNAKIGG